METSGNAAPRPSAPAKTEVGSVFISNYPPFSFWGEEAVPDLLNRFQQPVQADVPMGLYLHVPFCRKRCKFCYFKVYTDKNSRQIQAYLDAVTREIERVSAYPAVAGRKPRFIYVGGGTPSYISARHLRGVFRALEARFPFDEVQEVTFECEPGTLTQAKLAAIREVGVTRLSLGVENFDDQILSDNGRAHISTEIYRVLPWIREMGFDQVNIDLIAGMVGETWDNWKANIEKAIEVDPDSITIYQMELPYNTKYSQGLLKGESGEVFADWATKRAWHDYAISRLIEAGYDVSSGYTMVKRDKACRFVYRDALWHGADLIPLGCSSFGHLGGVHYQNHPSIERYVAAIEAGEAPLRRAFKTSETDRLRREALLQLKMGRLQVHPFREKYGVDIREVFADHLDDLVATDMAHVEGEEIRLTRQGLLRVDSLLPGFYEEKYRGSRYT
ncbi:Coproporphyrinogen III oxidase family protein [Sulfidibacter corallicola]|uniref:Coproporphyrinogen III oxidase family protein n=1 Tax=Sulfidibacter corallicola TaxID=2818388 RepID=A0A8A4TNJ3_SULCO|nr:coproporphyrinogen-III oxidase family protein [Sulfidibacter corallicola]QTD51536.1 coproporphyrinogen III oxidase family protein [Sulfidibacter corallicola]